MKSFMSSVTGSDGSYAIWAFLRNQMQQERVMSKYLALVEGGFYANALEVAHGVRVSNHTYAADVIGFQTGYFARYRVCGVRRDAFR